jgi:septum formation protein
MPDSGPLPRLVLASASPRRRRLLEGLGIQPFVRPVDIPEIAGQGEHPDDLVMRLAREKATAHVGSHELILAADTLVVLDGQVLGKPGDRLEAVEMLTRLAGREHTVLTGIALLDTGSGRLEQRLEKSRVRMAALEREQIDWYVDTGEPMDKAGAYAIQGLGALFVEAVYGSYTNVVGLPLPAVARLFRELGRDLREFRAEPIERRRAPSRCT